MNPSILHHRVNVQKRTVKSDPDNGEPIETWSSIGDRWANIKPLTAAEVLKSGQVNHNVSHVITLRYFPDMTADCRIVYRGRVFNIFGLIDVNERKTVHEARCNEVT